MSEKENEKVIFDLDINRKKQTKRIATNIFQMDENNQYVQAMTKPLSYGCIRKQKNLPSLLEFNAILDRISHEDNIDNLFIVDIKFHNINEKTFLFKESYPLYPSIFEKKIKKMESIGRSTIQLMSILVRNKEKDTLNSFRYSCKTHPILQCKKFILLYQNASTF